MKSIVLFIAIGCLFFIFLQDIKDRRVSVLLLAMNCLTLGSLHFLNGNHKLLVSHTAINIGILTPMSLAIYAYIKLVLKTTVQESIGLGDLFWILALAFGFPTVTFIVLLSFSFLFSLALHLLVKNYSKNPLVPLAGYQSLFLLLILLTDKLLPVLNLYML